MDALAVETAAVLFSEWQWALLGVQVALTLALLQDRCRNRHALPPEALTGIDNSAWRTLYRSRNRDAFITTLALTPEVFEDLLAVVGLPQGSCRMRVFPH